MCTALAMMSKVQPGIVVLVAMVALWPGSRSGLDRRVAGRVETWILLLVVLGLTALFVAINWHATAESRMFAGAEASYNFV